MTAKEKALLKEWENNIKLEKIVSKSMERNGE